tara:strand:- start:47 stop:565 length:519 start_codon:yes stop_codon:yes gene_type:complete
MGILVWEEDEMKWIKDSLTYCPDTGRLRWKERFSNRVAKDLLVSSLDGNGYVRVSHIFNGKRRTFKGHRVGWFLHYGYQPTMLDHINQDKSDNRIINLRECSMTKNLGNQKPSNVLGIKGVVKKRDGKYQARCFKVHLGLFDDPIDAAKAYDAEAIKVFGEFAYTNKQHGVY